MLLCAYQYIAHHLSTSLALALPTSQNYLRYMTTCCVFTTVLAFRKGEKSLFNVIKTRGYRYILIGLVDLEANTLVGMSHQFSSLINIQVSYSSHPLSTSRWILIFVLISVPRLRFTASVNHP